MTKAEAYDIIVTEVTNWLNCWENPTNDERIMCLGYLTGMVQTLKKAVRKEAETDVQSGS